MFTRPKRQMPTQSPLLIITSSPGAICGITTMSTKEKKSQKLKIPSIPSIKKAVTEAKCPHVNDFIDDFANIVSSMFFQSAKDQVEYKDYTLVYHYCLSLILRSFNQTELMFCSLQVCHLFIADITKMVKKL